MHTGKYKIIMNDILLKRHVESNRQDHTRLGNASASIRVIFLHVSVFKKQQLGHDVVNNNHFKDKLFF